MGTWNKMATITSMILNGISFVFQMEWRRDIKDCSSRVEGGKNHRSR